LTVSLLEHNYTQSVAGLEYRHTSLCIVNNIPVSRRPQIKTPCDVYFLAEMRRTIHRILFLTLALALALASASVALSQQAAQSLTLSGSDPLRFKPGDEDAGLDVFNNTAAPLEGVTVKLVGTEQTKGKYLTDVVEMVAPEPRRLDPASAMTIKFRAKEGAEEGEYTGYLVVYHAASNGAARRKIQLVVETKKTGEAAAVKPQPLVKEWEVKVHKWPFLSQGLGTYLPVAHAQPKQEVEVIGYLQGSLGNVAEVRSTGKRSSLTDKADELELSFKGVDGPGIFTGKVDPLGTGSDDKDDVEMTVTVAHYFIFPVLFLVAGLFISLWFQQRYIGVLRPVWELGQKEAHLGTLFDNAQAKFSRESKDESYHDYTIEDDVRRKREELRGQLDALSQTTSGRLDESNPAYKKIADELNRLAAVFVEWGSFAAKLLALKGAESGARAALVTASQPGFLPSRISPRILTHAHSLLQGVPLTISGFETRVAAVVAARSAAEAWQTLNDGVIVLRDMLGTINFATLDEATKDEFPLVKKEVDSVWYDLWQVEDFKAEEVKKRLLEIHKSISLISASQKSPQSAADAESRSLDRSFSINFERAEVPADDRERESFFRRRLLNVDLAYIALSLLVAVNTGLGQLYYDKPFGTLRDYLNVLLWGFAAQTLLSAFTAGLQHLWNWRSTLNRL